MKYDKQDKSLQHFVQQIREQLGNHLKELSRLRRNFFDRINRINMILLFSLYPEHPVYPV